MSYVITLPEATTGIVRNLKKTTLYLRLPQTGPGAGDRKYERENVTIPLPPNEDVELFWEDFKSVEKELIELRRKKFISIIRWPRHLQKTSVTTGPTPVPIDPSVTENMVVRFDGSLYQPASADSPLHAMAIGIAKNVDPVTHTAEVYLFGTVPSIPGLVTGELYYLSTTPGQMSPATPTNGYSIPIGTALNSVEETFHLNIDLNIDYFIDTFDVSGWFSSDSGDLFSMDFDHGLGVMFPKIAIFESTNDEVLVHRTRVLDSNSLRISVCQAGVDGRFSGVISVSR